MTAPTVRALALLAAPVVAAVTGTTPGPTAPAPASSGPGIVGFLVTFALVVACIPLFLSMTRKIRGVRYRSGADAPEGSAAGPGADGPDGAPDAGPDGAPDSAAHEAADGAAGEPAEPGDRRA